MKKLLTILLILALLPLTIPGKVKGISDVSVTVNPAGRLDYGEYTITLTTGAELKGGIDSIIIQFPTEANIPCTSCAYGHCPSCFKVNGYNASRVGLVEGYTKTIYISMPGGITMKQGDKVEIIIAQGANFQNPSTPGKYYLNIWSTQEPTKVQAEFEITSTKIQNLSVEVKPDTANLPATYTLTFQTGAKGELNNGQFIYLNFPSESQFPAALKITSITINGSSPSEVKIINTNTLSLKLSESIGPSLNCTIVIYGTFGIKNPKNGGSYNLSICSDAEPEPISTTFTITEENKVSTLIQTDPVSPDGLNNYFRIAPKVTLTAETNTQEQIQTFYKIDDGVYQPYSIPFTMPEGIHTLKYYSKTDTLIEKEQTKIFKVDTIAPQLNIEIPSKDISYTYNSTAVISGYLNEDAQLSINSTYVALKDNHAFTFELPLTIGENTITLRAIDLAGNHTLEQIKIILDETTPVLTIESPNAWSKITTKYITIKGNIYPVNTNVYAGNQKVPTKEDGSFDYQYIPETFGSLISVKVTAIYQLTGRSTEKDIIIVYEPQSNKILLTIGKNTVDVNGIQKIIDVAPFIEKTSGRTLVPVRFISECLGFEVVWDAQSKTVSIKDSSKTIILTIGNKVASISEKAYEMDVAPLIKDSRTFVPLRFISEALGYNVNWDAKTQTITISK